MYEFYDLDSRALVSNDMTLVHDFVLYVTGYEKDIFSSSDGFVPFALKGEGGSSIGEFEGYYNGSLGEIAVYPSSSAVTFDGSALNVALPSQYTYSKGETDLWRYPGGTEGRDRLW